MDRLVFRAPGTALPIEVLLARAFARDDAALFAELIDTGSVVVDARALSHRGARIEAGARVEVSAPRLPLPAEAEQHAAQWRVLLPGIPWRRGRLRGEGSKRKPAPRVIEAFECRTSRGPIGELLLQGEVASHAQVLARLARAGWPALGDARRGGILVEGGVRLRAVGRDGEDGVDAADETGWWPAEPVHARPETSRPFAVSAATARVLARGHPWILPDDESDDAARLAPGARVQVVDPHGKPLATALIEGEGRIAARVLDAAQGAGAGGSVASRVDRALARRSGIGERESARTDAYRLIHAEADGLPGLCVDRVGSLLRVLVTGRAALPLVDDVVAALRGAALPGLGPDAPVLEVLHLRDRPAGDLECVRWHASSLAAAGKGGAVDAAARAAAERGVVFERGLAFVVEPGLKTPCEARPGFGLYLDQRENRARLAKLARAGGRWLNLFCHTGAFSVALLAAGAESVTSVDLSGAYLAWLDENLAHNAERGVDAARHEGVRRDGRRYLEGLGARVRFDGIVLDPPTAAAVGRRFWSADRELTPLLAAALAHLAPGGRLLVCRNTRGTRRSLDALAEEAAKDARVAVASIDHAGPGPDFPRLRGFPEGDSFQGRIITRR